MMLLPKPEPEHQEHGESISQAIVVPPQLPHLFHGQALQDLQHSQPMQLHQVVYVCLRSDVRVDMAQAVMPIRTDDSILQIVLLV